MVGSELLHMPTVHQSASEKNLFPGSILSAIGGNAEQMKTGLGCKKHLLVKVITLKQRHTAPGARRGPRDPQRRGPAFALAPGPSPSEGVLLVPVSGKPAHTLLGPQEGPEAGAQALQLGEVVVTALTIYLNHLAGTL